MITSNVLVLVAIVVFSAFFGIAIAVLAVRKGYSFAAWFGTGGTTVLSAIVLGLLPDTRNPSLAASERTKAIARGNMIGTALSLLTILVAFVAILARLLSFSVASGDERSQFFERLYMPATQFVTWLQLLTFLVALCAYSFGQRRPRSTIVVLSLAVLVFVEAYFSIAAVFDRRLATEVPVQLVYSCHYLARAFYYFGLTGLCIGLLSARQPTGAATI